MSAPIDPNIFGNSVAIWMAEGVLDAHERLNAAGPFALFGDTPGEGSTQYGYFEDLDEVIGRAVGLSLSAEHKWLWIEAQRTGFRNTEDRYGLAVVVADSWDEIDYFVQEWGEYA